MSVCMNLWKNNMPWFIFTQKVLDDFLVLFVLETIPVDEHSQSVVILQYSLTIQNLNILQ